jgi:hypothetical protein
MSTAISNRPASMCRNGHRDGNLLYITHRGRGIAECPNCHVHYERAVREEEWKGVSYRTNFRYK